MSESRLKVRKRDDPLTEIANHTTKALVRRRTRVDGSIAYASRFLKGRKAALMELASLSEHEGVKAVVAEWNQLSDRKKREPHIIESLCEAMDLPPSDFLGQVVKAAFEVNTDVGKLVAAVEHPRVVQAAIKSALKPKGMKDREMLLQAAGFVPRGKGISITTKAVAAAKAELQSSGTQSFEEQAIEVADIVRGEK